MTGIEGQAAAPVAETGAARPDPPRDRPDLSLAARLADAQRALLSRPRLSIRLRLVTSLSLCFALCLAFAVGSLDILRTTRTKLRILQALERLDDRILRAQARGYEGGPSSVEQRKVLEGFAEVESVLRRDPDAVETADRDVVPLLLGSAAECRRLATLTRSGGAAPGAGAARDSLSALRRAHEEAHRLLAETIRNERVAVARVLRIAEAAPLVLLGVLLVSFVVITTFFAKALANPIARFKGYTARIAAGDFSLIRPARRYRDEFSDLAVAVNQMLAELRTQQDRVVKGAKLAAVGTLTSGIAHELNNPLNNISITTETLMEDLKTIDDEEKWRLLQDIYFETERAGEIVKSLLDFTRHERPELVSLDLAEILKSTFRLAQNEMVINNVTFDCDLPAGLPRVRGAANRLRQVFLNLILNAIQAMPGGGRLRATADTHHPERVCINIRDQGAGIAPDVLPLIFDPFFTTKEPGKGTGLGLSVSLGIVRSLGGDILVESEVGKGTTVHVCLPRAED